MPLPAIPPWVIAAGRVLLPKVLEEVFGIDPASRNAAVTESWEDESDPYLAECRYDEECARGEQRTHHYHHKCSEDCDHADDYW